MWLAGAGVKGGQALGATDELGFDAVEARCHVADLHATGLHLMGLDHTRLTYFHQGFDQRLTGVRGVVVEAAGTGDPHPAVPATFSRGEKGGAHRPLLMAVSDA